jgi:hypothetical protein
MKKIKSASDDLRPEYQRSDFKRLERGKYYQRVKPSSKVVVLGPDVGTIQSGKQDSALGAKGSSRGV